MEIGIDSFAKKTQTNEGGGIEDNARAMNELIERWMNELKDEWMNEWWMNEMKEEWMNWRMNEWSEGWMNELIDEWINNGWIKDDECGQCPHQLPDLPRPQYCKIGWMKEWMIYVE